MLYPCTNNDCREFCEYEVDRNAEAPVIKPVNGQRSRICYCHVCDQFRPFNLLDVVDKSQGVEVAAPDEASSNPNMPPLEGLAGKVENPVGLSHGEEKLPVEEIRSRIAHLDPDLAAKRNLAKIKKPELLSILRGIQER